MITKIRPLWLLSWTLAASLALFTTIAVAEEAPLPDADGWYSLFNGKDLSGWRASEDSPETFRVEEGKIVVDGPRAHLYYDGPVKGANFKNFEWKCDVFTKPGANSGMYFHTRYQPDGWPAHGLEAQINNTSGDRRKTGSIYRASDILDDSPAKDEEWFTQHVIVRGRHIIVKINGEVVNDHVEPENPERDGGWEKNVLSSGTLALQGHDPQSKVYFRNIFVKPLPDEDRGGANRATSLPKAGIDGSEPGWQSLGADDFVNVNCFDDTFTWKEDGMIYCTGQPIGVIRTQNTYTNFELVAQWRHLSEGGNSGIFVWTSDEALEGLEPGQLPRGGIEVQILDHGYAQQYERRHGETADWFTTHGDVFPVGTATMKPFEPTSPNGSRSFPRKNLSKGVGEWNHYYVRCINGEIRLWVNGTEVSGGNECEPSTGYLCLESEGAPIEFRELRVREVP